MGQSQSKLFRFVPYTCYDLGHTWNPSCTESTVEVGLTCFREALKIYSSVYVLSAVIRGKFPDAKALTHLVKNIVQSSAFLSYNAFSFVWAFCTFHRIFKCHNYYTFGWLSSWVASFLSIFVERPSRRSMLAVYVGNVATESLLMSDSNPFSLKYGEVFLFSALSSVLLYLYRQEKNSTQSDFMFTVIRLLVGKAELSTNMKQRKKRQFSEQSSTLSVYWRQTMSTLKNILTNNGNCLVCPHSDETCLQYIAKGFLFPFTAGTFAQIGVNMIQRLFRGKTRSTFALSTLKPGLFLGCFSGVFKLTSCLLRGTLGGDSALIAIPSGFLAGFSMIFYASKSVAIYILWKTLEILCRLGVSKGWLPNIPFAVELLYATATAVLFHMAVVSPHNLKPSYYAFMRRITGQRVHEINRVLLDHEYGTNASAVYKHLPKYNEQFISQWLKNIWPSLVTKSK